MASNLSEDTLKSLKKDDIIKLFINFQKEVLSKIDNLSNEVKMMFGKIESDVQIVKNANKLLRQQVTELQRNTWSNSQYSRRDCLEIVGFSDEVGYNSLEEKVCELFGKIGNPITNDKIQAVHRLHNKKSTIVKLCNRKDCLSILKSRNKLKDISMEELGFTPGTKIFINESLCSYYKVLWSKSKQLFLKKKIAAFYTTNGTVKIRIRENSAPISITHDVDLAEHFPDFDFNRR